MSENKKSYIFLILIGALLGPLPAAHAFADEVFHPASTAAEKALDKILGKAEEDDNIFEFVLHRPWYNPSLDNGYSSMFTNSFLADTAKAEATMVQKDCGGHYIDGEICGLDYDPITCGQDTLLARYYRTEKSSPKEAVVLLSVSHDGREHASYTLVHNEEKWQLDQVRCAH